MTIPIGHVIDMYNHLVGMDKWFHELVIVVQKHISFQRHLFQKVLKNPNGEV